MLLYVWSWTLLLFWGICPKFQLCDSRFNKSHTVICWDMNSTGSANCFLLLIEIMRSFSLFSHFLISSEAAIPTLTLILGGNLLKGNKIFD